MFTFDLNLTNQTLVVTLLSKLGGVRANGQVIFPSGVVGDGVSWEWSGHQLLLMQRCPVPCAHCKSETKYFLFMDGEEVNSKRPLHLFWLFIIGTASVVVICHFRIIVIFLVIDRDCFFLFYYFCSNLYATLFCSWFVFFSLNPSLPSTWEGEEWDARIALPCLKPTRVPMSIHPRWRTYLRVFLIGILLPLPFVLTLGKYSALQSVVMSNCQQTKEQNSEHYLSIGCLIVLTCNCVLAVTNYKVSKKVYID